MKDESIRRRLMTTLSAAVRIGRSGGLTDSQVGTELQDLADLYLAAVEPIRMPTVAAWQLGLDDAQPASLGALSEPPQDWPRCNFTTAADSHMHLCDKAHGHADGPGGSDHSCEMCGALYDANGGEASPLTMGAVSTVSNGPVEEPGEME
jgi:hypothetical protein